MEPEGRLIEPPEGLLMEPLLLMPPERRVCEPPEGRELLYDPLERELLIEELPCEPP